MKENKNKMAKALALIATDRHRTNLLRKPEQNAIAYMVQKIPSWVSSDGLTVFGFFGNIMVAVSFVLGAYINRYCLLVSLLGFTINWIGDSLDGRLAYYRNKPRKWHGFSLDLTIDWIGTILIGIGYTFYATGWSKYFGFFFVALYGWEMITALLRYKISGKYSIDSGVFGPTEVRIILAIIIILEVIFPGLLNNLAAIACLILLASNIFESWLLSRLANKQDKLERHLKEKGEKRKQAQND